MTDTKSRREFIGAAAGAGMALAIPRGALGAEALPKPARLGGPKAHPGGFPGWPVIDATDEEALLAALRSGKWFRGYGTSVSDFEAAYANLTGAKKCVATACGTAALTTALGALELGPGDEVILPPYTFVATHNAVTLAYALPVYVDTDPETFQIDAGKIEAAFTDATRAILPVHVGGSPADMEKIMEVANRQKLPVIEDACQAHLAEWRGRSIGTQGLAGCFSFQASKNLTSCEGGAILTNDEAFAEACFSFHNQGRAKLLGGANWSGSGTRGSNLRLSEFQGSLLLAQMARLKEQSDRRTENAAHLTELMKDIPGIAPAKLHEGATRSAYHLFMFRYDKSEFAGLARGKFLEALGAEGIPASGGYAAMNKGEYVLGLARNPRFLKIYGERRMSEWAERTREACPANEKLCEEAVWFTQNMLLGTREDMEQIALAIRKIRAHAGELANA